MKIAFTSTGKDWDAKIDPRFGRTEFLMFFTEETNELEVFDNSSITREAHGAGPKTSMVLLEAKPDVLITGNGPGGNAATILERGQIDIYIGAGALTIREAYEKYKSGELNKF